MSKNKNYKPQTRTRTKETTGFTPRMKTAEQKANTVVLNGVLSTYYSYYSRFARTPQGVQAFSEGYMKAISEKVPSKETLLRSLFVQQMVAGIKAGNTKIVIDWLEGLHAMSSVGPVMTPVGIVSKDDIEAVLNWHAAVIS